MIINIPTVVEELKENATEEQRCGLNILERRFYECINLNKKLEIATKALKKHQKAIKEFKKDPMDNLVMLSHQVIYDIYMDTQKALKEIDLVGTSMSQAKEEV